MQNISPLSEGLPQSPQTIIAEPAVFDATKPASEPVILITSSEYDNAPLFAAAFAVGVSPLATS
jgi:hypothetical protein